MSADTSGSLENQVRELQARVLRLEDTLQKHGLLSEGGSFVRPKDAAEATDSLPPQTVSSPEPPPPPNPIPPLTQPYYAVPPSFAEAPQRKEEDISLENRIGSHWFNRIGILAVLIGAAWFLKFAFDNQWIGPLGRVAIGLFSGAGAIAWSERFRSRGYSRFSYALKAIGSGCLYLSLWAAFSLYHLVPAAVAFLAMIAVTAFNGFVAWKQDSQLLSLYAIVGGLSSPLLVSTGEVHEVALCSYLLILNLAALGLILLKPWVRLLISSFFGTWLFLIPLGFDVLDKGSWTWYAFFLGCFFILYSLSPRLIASQEPLAEPPAGLMGFVLIALPSLTAISSFLMYCHILNVKDAFWLSPWLAVLFAGYYLGLVRLPAWGFIRKSPFLLTTLHLSFAVVFLSITIPLKTQGPWLSIGWLIEGGALLWVASKARSLILRGFALSCLVLGLGRLFLGFEKVSTTPILNERFGCYLIAIGTTAFVGWLSNSLKDEKEDGPFAWKQLVPTSIVVTNFLVLCAFSWEIHNYWWNVRWSGAVERFTDFKIYAQFSYSAFFMTCGAILLAGGFFLRSAFLRWQALLLLSFAIGKVFLWDVSELSQGYRILSFMGLGVLLLAVSFVYQRDLLHLRGRGNQDS